MVKMLVVGSFLALILGVLVGMPILRSSMQTVTLGEQPNTLSSTWSREATDPQTEETHLNP